MTSGTATGLLLAVLALAGCASTNSPSKNDPFSEAERPSSVRIIIQNRNFSDARTYALRRGNRIRLGTVVGTQDAEFTLPWTLSDIMSIEISLLAGPTCTTPELVVDPGDILELRILPAFDRSWFCR